MQSSKQRKRAPKFEVTVSFRVSVAANIEAKELVDSAGQIFFCFCDFSGVNKYNLAVEIGFLGKLKFQFSDIFGYTELLKRCTAAIFFTETLNLNDNPKI